MRICLFSMMLPVHFTGGMEIHSWDIAKGLKLHGQDVTIITGRHPDNIEYEEKEGVKIYYVGEEKANSTYPRSYWALSQKKFMELNTIKEFDIIHTQSAAAWGIIKKNLGRKCGVPIVSTLHGTTFGEIKTILNNPMSFKSILIICFYIVTYITVSLKFIKSSDFIIVTSNESKEELKKQYIVQDEKLIVIPNGVDTEIFKPDLDVLGLKEKYGLQKKRVILSIGVMMGQKGQSLLLRILPELLRENKNIRLVLVGYGPELNNLKNLAEELKISKDVVFTGKIPHEELKFYYNIADVFVHPTLRLEAGPLVIPQAMSCEKPVIASRIGGIPTVIKNYEDGILIEPGSLKELKEAILQVLNDEELAKRLGTNARKNVMKRYSVDRMIKDTILVYKKVLDTR